MKLKRTADTAGNTPATTGLPDLSDLLSEGETLQATAALDMNAQGAFEAGHLILTNQRLFRVTTGIACQVSAQVDRSEILSLCPRHLPGALHLSATTAVGVVVLSYYSRACSKSVETLLAHLQQPKHDEPQEKTRAPGASGQPPGEGDQQTKEKICEHCGKVIPHRIGHCPECLDKARLYRRLLVLARPYLWPMTGGLALMLLITFIEMTQPILTKILIDRVIPESNLGLFVWILAGIVAIHTFSALFSGTRAFMMAWLGERIVHDLRQQVYAHLQGLSLDFYDQRQTGWIMDRVSADTANLQNFLAEGFQDLIRDIMTIVVILGIMATMNWQLALVTMLPAPIVAFLTMRFVKRVRPLFHRMWRRRSFMSSHLSNVIPGVRVVKAFAQEQREAQRFAQASKGFMDAGIASARAFATFHPVIHFITSLGFVMVWGFGGYLVISGRGVTLGTLIAFISYLWRFYGPVNNLSRFSQRLERATTSAQRVFDVLDTKASVTDKPQALTVEQLSGAVAFNNVSFGYDSDAPVLTEVSFAVQPGEMIGLVGPSGAGKSTTINLLCRFYDVNSGSITLDGHDVRDLSRQSIHNAISVVLQEPFLFQGSIHDNIAYGNPQAPALEVMSAAKAANAHDFIMRFEQGYDTLVGERGQRLSGGERQRISIARALLKNPRILILDEATSSVDTETEATIQEAIARLVKGRTTFAIAHRFSTLRNADRLIVLDEGRVAEIGTHEELLARPDGVFRRLVEIQTRTSQIVAVGG